MTEETKAVTKKLAKNGSIIAIIIFGLLGWFKEWVFNTDKTQEQNNIAIAEIRIDTKNIKENQKEGFNRLENKVNEINIKQEQLLEMVLMGKHASFDNN